MESSRSFWKGLGGWRRRRRRRRRSVACCRGEGATYYTQEVNGDIWNSSHPPQGPIFLYFPKCPSIFNISPNAPTFWVFPEMPLCFGYFPKCPYVLGISQMPPFNQAHTLEQVSSCVIFWPLHPRFGPSHPIFIHLRCGGFVIPFPHPLGPSKRNIVIEENDKHSVGDRIMNTSSSHYHERIYL